MWVNKGKEFFGSQWLAWKYGVVLNPLHRWIGGQMTTDNFPVWLRHISSHIHGIL